MRLANLQKRKQDMMAWHMRHICLIAVSATLDWVLFFASKTGFAIGLREMAHAVVDGRTRLA